jgi:hypothetical protein
MRTTGLARARKLLFAIIAALALAVGIVILSPPITASAYTAPADGKAVVIYSGVSSNWRVVDIEGGSTSQGAWAQIYEPNTTEAQTFRLEKSGFTYYIIRNVKSGLVLDAQGAGKTNGTPIWQYPSNGTAAQKWIIESLGGGWYRIVSALDTNMVLDVAGAGTLNGTKLQLYRWNGTNAQKFTFTDKQGWSWEQGYRYFYANGKKLEGLYSIDNSSYYFYPSGGITWITLGMWTVDRWFPTGAMVTNCRLSMSLFISGIWVYDVGGDGKLPNNPEYTAPH